MWDFGRQVMRAFSGVGQVIGGEGEATRVVSRVWGCGRRRLGSGRGSRLGWRRSDGVRAEWDQGRRCCGTWRASCVRHWRRGYADDVDGRVCVAIAPVEGLGCVDGTGIVTTWPVASVRGERLKRRGRHGCACSREPSARMAAGGRERPGVGVETSPGRRTTG
jgi:hypothetical protein